jgi:hypothetical protein
VSVKKEKKLPEKMSGSSSESSSLVNARFLRVPSHAAMSGEVECCLSADLSELGAYELQVGGHAEFVKLSSNSRVVLKPYDSSEFQFYTKILSEKTPRLLPLTARCFGAVTGLDSPSLAPKFVMLEDLAHGLQRPCIVDLKMGLVQRNLRNSTPEKISSARAKAAATTSLALGFRICGVVFEESETRIFQDKYVGRSLDVSGVFVTFRRFFRSHIKLILAFVAKLRALVAAISDLPGLRFWSGSIL